MIHGVPQELNSIGDIYFFNIVFPKAEPRRIVRIGGPAEADIHLDSGAGKLFSYLFEHQGQFFDLEALSEVTGIKPITLYAYVRTLDSRFSYSKSYQMVSRNRAEEREYGVVERGIAIDANPVRNSRKYKTKTLEDLAKKVAKASIKSQKKEKKK